MFSVIVKARVQVNSLKNVLTSAKNELKLWRIYKYEFTLTALKTLKGSPCSCVGDDSPKE